MRSRLAALGVLMVFWSNAASAEALRVVASIKPLQSLAAGVMLGVGQPDVLIKGGGSAHAYSLRPSDARMLADADVILWIGPRFETFLQRPLALGKHAQAVMLSETPGLKLLATRDAGLWSAKEQVSAESDGHIWLDPGNAKIIVAAIAEVLSARDPANAARYHDNAVAVSARLDTLDAELRASLVSVKEKPFVVYHDATHYFEARYGLNAVGALTVNPERAPGGRRLGQIRDEIAKLGAVCVFAEPQFEPKLVEMLARETSAKTGVLDAEGSTLEPGPDLYFNLMRGLAEGLWRCLSAL